MKPKGKHLLKDSKTTAIFSGLRRISTCTDNPSIFRIIPKYKHHLGTIKMSHILTFKCKS